MLRQNKKQIYNLTSEEVLESFGSRLEGLSDQEAKSRLKIYGYNKIEKKQRWKWLRLVFGQFNDALVWILLVAASLAYFFHEYRDTTIILIIVAINAIIGFFQEFRAERILDSIKKLTTDKALIMRGGQKREIDSRSIVPGDIILVAAGDNVPADGLIIEAYDLRVSSFIFTGESKPERKSAKKLEEKKVALADIDNMLFMGETVATGEAKMIVSATAMETELGKIAGLAQEIKDDPTPMQKQMRRLGKYVTILAIFIGVLVIIGGQYFKMSLYQNFLFALALSVSVVPEGLPAAVSVALSVGMRRLLKDNVLAKKLNAVETLGSVGMICTDKTGTITRNELEVVAVVVNGEIIDLDGEGYEPVGKFYQDDREINPENIANLEMLFRIGTLCNDAALQKKDGQWKIVGDPTEGAIIVAGKKYNGRDKFYEMGEEKITENPFSSERMRMSVVYKNSHTISYVKGSPDVMMDLCKYKKIGDDITPFTAKDKALEKELYNQMSRQALRVLAFAYRDMKGIRRSELSFESEKDLTWVGMMAMIDPPRSDVREALFECHDLGIKVMMITGDYEITARAIAENIGLLDPQVIGNESRVINGKTLDDLSDQELFEKIKEGVRVFARIAPEQKLRIATVIKNYGQVIAMTGDGVNDAPALRKADIGVAMGVIGTDVSKEASDMILMDDNFASIVKGVREGRTIFINLKKFVHYVFTSNASELFTVIAGVILGIPSPVSAVQILAVDLGTDVFPSFALGLEPEEPDSDHNKKKINSKHPVMDLGGFRRIVYMAVIMATGAVTAFIWSMIRGGWHFRAGFDANSLLYIKSTTAAYAVLSMTQMANLLQARSEKYSPFELGFFKNKYAIGSIFISIAILLSFMYVPFCQKYLHMAPIDFWDWMMVILSFCAVFLWEEGRKAEIK